MTVTALIYSQSQSSICEYDTCGTSLSREKCVTEHGAASHLAQHLDKLSKQLHNMKGAGKGWLLVLVPKET